MRIRAGEIGIIKEGEMHSYLQTCCGIIFKSPEMVGFSHSVVPSYLEDLYRKGGNKKDNFIVTPTQGALVLLKEIAKKGVLKKDLTAHIFGCQNQYFGLENYQEAREAISELGIPILESVAGKPYDIKLQISLNLIKYQSLDPTNFGLKKQGEISLR